MSNPVIADNKPVKVTLSKGQEYHFCTCGRSRSQPFCDGSHPGTGFTPRAVPVNPGYLSKYLIVFNIIYRLAGDSAPRKIFFQMGHRCVCPNLV